MPAADRTAGSSFRSVLARAYDRPPREGGTMVRRVAVPVVAMALLAGCGHVVWSSLPRASARHAYATSYKACRTGVQELGLRGFANRVGATSRRPAVVAHAAVRYAIPYVRE